MKVTTCITLFVSLNFPVEITNIKMTYLTIGNIKIFSMVISTVIIVIDVPFPYGIKLSIIMAGIADDCTLQ